MVDVTPELVLRAYAAGVFPMSEGRRDPRLFWVDPDRRGIIPLERFHLPRSLRKRVASGRFTVTIDKAFREVVEACAAPRPDRKGTWINDQIIALFIELHRTGHAHSVETWSGDRLVGGLYGLSLGAAFFGESMFSRETDASKVALVHLVARLIRGDYRLLDTQFVTDHLRRFGATEIARHRYHRLLQVALEQRADFYSLGDSPSPADVLQSITQTS